jgi:hypothetical protein
VNHLGCLAFDRGSEPVTSRNMSRKQFLDAMRKAGFEPYPEPVGIAIGIAICLRATQDVGREAGRLSMDFKDEILRRLAGIESTSSLTEIGIFPTVLDPGVAAMPDFVIHRRDGSVDVGINITINFGGMARGLKRSISLQRIFGLEERDYYRQIAKCPWT